MSPTLAHVLGNPHRETQGYGSCLEPIPRLQVHPRACLQLVNAKGVPHFLMLPWKEKLP